MSDEAEAAEPARRRRTGPAAADARAGRAAIRPWSAGGRPPAPRSLAASAERSPAFVTTSEIPVADVYTPADVAGLDPARDLGLPGEYPFTRGVQATMYRSRFWTMRQYAGFATAAETNERFRYLLAQGQTGLSVAFDLPTQMGYDSDAPEAEGEVGPGRRPDLVARRHGDPVRRHPAGRRSARR